MKLIDKDVVIAEISRIKKEECPLDTYEGRVKLFYFEKFLSFIKSLEVEECENKSWIKSEKKLPKHCELVFCALFDIQCESFQYYVGWYNADRKEWFLTDFGYTSDVVFWMPIPKLNVSDI